MHISLAMGLKIICLHCPVVAFNLKISNFVPPLTHRISWLFDPEKLPTTAVETFVGEERVRLRRCIGEIVRNLKNVKNVYKCITVYSDEEPPGGEWWRWIIYTELFVILFNLLNPVLSTCNCACTWSSIFALCLHYLVFPGYINPHLQRTIKSSMRDRSCTERFCPGMK